MPKRIYPALQSNASVNVACLFVPVGASMQLCTMHIHVC